MAAIRPLYKSSVNCVVALLFCLLFTFVLLLTGFVRQGQRCKACKMSVHHKCRDNVPYCPGDRVSVVLACEQVPWWGLESKRKKEDLVGELPWITRFFFRFVSLPDFLRPLPNKMPICRQVLCKEGDQLQSNLLQSGRTEKSANLVEGSAYGKSELFVMFVCGWDHN